jgi:hypothetical protein
MTSRRMTFVIATFTLPLCLGLNVSAGTICPAVGVAGPGTGANAGTGCYVLFTFTPNNTIVRSIDTTVGRYDSVDGDDITVGVVNLTSTPITSLALTKTNPNGDFSGANIMAFDGDGICAVSPPVAPSPPCPFLPLATGASSTYAGPAVTSFQILNLNEGIVHLNLPGGATAPSTTYFGLEDVPDGHTPEPASIVMVLTGAGIMLVVLGRMRSRLTTSSFRSL